MDISRRRKPQKNQFQKAMSIPTCPFGSTANKHVKHKLQGQNSHVLSLDHNIDAIKQKPPHMVFGKAENKSSEAIDER